MTSAHTGRFAPRAVLAILAVAGCWEEPTDAGSTGVPPTCKVGVECAGPSGIFGSSGGEGGGGGASGTLGGSITQTIDDGFVNVIAYSGPATIRAASASGGLVEASYVDGSFKLAGVATGGDVLFQVVDETPGIPDILSTLSYAAVKGGGGDAVTLVAVSEAVMTSVAGCISVPLDPASAHAVLHVLPNDGIPVSVPPSGALGTIAYADPDPQAACRYSLGLDASVGVILLLNIPPPSDGRLPLAIEKQANVFSGVIDVRPGAVTDVYLTL